MKYIFCLLITIILSYIFALTLFKNMPSTFYDINIAQAMTPIVQLMIAFGIAYFINIKLSNNNKINEILIELLDTYKKSFEKLNKYAVSYMETKNEKEAQKILLLITETSQQLTFLEQLNNNHDLKDSLNIKEMRSNHTEYKKRLTNKAFKQAQEYTDIQKKSVSSAFHSTLNHISLLKIGFYK